MSPVMACGPSAAVRVAGTRSRKRCASRAKTSIVTLSTEPTLRYTVLGATPISRAMSLRVVLEIP